MRFDTIPARDLMRYIRQPDCVLVDVRSPGEYHQGHIPGAVNMPYEDMEAAAPSLPKNRTYILYCDRGAASLLAARRLYNRGYDVISVIGGMAAYRGPLSPG